MEKLVNDFSFGLFIWQIILFLLLLFLLRKYAWRPILNAVNEREQGIKDALASAEDARREMENLQADNDKLLKEARAERDAMMKEAREVKAKMIADAKEEAQAEANKMITQAQSAIESEKKAAMAELKSHVAELSVQIAEKVVKKELSSEKEQLQLVDSMLDDAKLN